jgi:hypothetical protein
VMTTAVRFDHLVSAYASSKEMGEFVMTSELADTFGVKWGDALSAMVAWDTPVHDPQPGTLRCKEWMEQKRTIEELASLEVEVDRAWEKMQDAADLYLLGAQWPSKTEREFVTAVRAWQDAKRISKRRSEGRGREQERGAK